MMVLGSSIWAYIIGSACGIIATLNPHLIEYRQTMDELNYFCKDRKLYAAPQPCHQPPCEAASECM